MAPKKTSYPKQDIKVLLLEGISANAVETFRAEMKTPSATRLKIRPISTAPSREKSDMDSGG